MVNELLKIFGLKNEVDNGYKKMLEFPKTLIIVGMFSLSLMVINTLTDFLRFNRLLNDSLYALVIFVLLIGIGLRIKVELDFKHTKADINEKYWDEYSKFYQNILDTNKFGDVKINLEENMLSNKIKYKCINQDVDEEMVYEFVTNVIDGKSDDIDLLKKYPMENWDIYTIYGLKKAIIKDGTVVLYMKDKLPNDKQQTDEAADIIAMYLNAYSTLVKEKQVIYRKQKEKEEIKRGIIDIERPTEMPILVPKMEIKEEVKEVSKENTVSEEELAVREMLNDEKFKDKDISEIIEILNKVKNEKKGK